MLNTIISALVQLLVFALIPFIWWLVSARKNESFFTWIGFKKIEIKNRKVYLITIVSLLFVTVFIGIVVLPNLINASDNAVTSTGGTGLTAIITILIFSYIKTGLAEEIFFRGFVAKRLINKFGFKTGNMIQGFIFGALHGLLFLMITGPMIAGIIILITGFSGWFSGWFNEKQSGGSILSSWLLHGSSNAIIAFIGLMQ
jgi:membrane protease YdiL (CAAX protease family)